MKPRAKAAPEEFRPPRVVAGLSAMLAKAVGAAVVLLVVNYALGAAWDSWRGNESPSGAAVDRLNLVGVTNPDPNGAVDIPPGTPPDPRQFQNPMRRRPWAAEYFRNLQHAPVQFWPFSDEFNADYRSTYINQTHGIRDSYRPRGLRSPHPVIWFYGGSTLWGEGQRDDYTISSYVARLAEADGLPVEVQNHGVRGLVSWEETRLFETDLAEGPAPTMAVFYDGFNECTAALYAEQSGAAGQPWQLIVGDMRSRLAAADPGTTGVGPGLVGAYTRHSLVNRLLDRLRSALSDSPAGALPRAVPKPSRLDRDCATVYRRSRSVFTGLGDAAGSDVVSFWQPVRYPVNGQEHYGLTTAELVGPPTVNISAALDGRQDVYIDGGHTDEVGAELVAKAMYRTLHPKLVAWYRAHG